MLQIDCGDEPSITSAYKYQLHNVKYVIEENQCWSEVNTV